MKRKDCETRRSTVVRRGGRVATLAVVAWLVAPSGALAGSVRLWPFAVVTADSIRLDDVCQVQGFDHATERQMASLPIGEAPPPGGSRIVHLGMIRTALASEGVNLAEVTFGGSIRCEITRPADLGAARRISGDETNPQILESDHSRSLRPVAPGTGTGRGTSKKKVRAADSRQGETLRQFVVDFLNKQLARYQGRAEVVFDRTEQQVLDLAGPEFTFQVRGGTDTPVGLTSLVVDVHQGNRLIQSIPLVVQVSLVRPTVVARRAINQGAEIQPGDVEVAPLRYTSLSRLGETDAARVVGQRAKRLIRAGTTIEAGMLEQVPLVVRGQLVSIASIAGGVRVVTSGKATGEGLLGEVVTVRPTDDRRIELNAVVVGPGQVQIGGRVPARFERLAAGEGGS